MKPVVRLVVDKKASNVVIDFCQRHHWPWRLSDCWLETVFHTNLNDTFTRFAYSKAPADCNRLLFIGREDSTRRAESLEAMPDPEAAIELALLYGYPKCCTAAYAEVQRGVPWLEVFLRGSDPQGKIWDWRGNKTAYLFPPHHTLLPEYFPCSVNCKSTIRLAQIYEALLHDNGLDELLNIVRVGLMQPLLLFGGSLYRFEELELQGDSFHVIGFTEHYNIGTSVMPNQETNKIQSIRFNCGELILQDSWGERHEPLMPGRTQLLRFG
ncbi:MAG: hypothetical protein WCK63_11685 [Betaproteobacteria bacterium]